MPREEDPLSEDDLDRSMYSESDFEYHLSTAENGESEKDDGEEDPSEGTSSGRKMRSSVMIRHVNVRQDKEIGEEDECSSGKSKGKGGKRGEPKGGDRERSIGRPYESQICR